ncbi:MAG: alpha-L-fucosidase [Cyclobacteriaceae bacterium]|nr:alpha-L-fucosidase [Cyclobacteriaceae bacterium]
MKWHEMQFYAFVHFNMNTFTDMEWGLGGESPELFNPSELDCRQWARVCKDAGMKGIILTAKHHDGFCLWPSAFTEHSVKNSPWKNGQGDVVRELADACKEYGLKLGLYLSPWDRNHPEYGNEKYLDYYRNQLRELMTNYGEVFEVWFDGANGGTGFYGGANENRRVDRKNYYDWPNTRQIVRVLQPNAVMFSDAGPDVRWVGNEQGWAGETNWCLLRANEFYPGSPNWRELPVGHEDGTYWVPAEVDVSIRPGWFYHPSEDHRVKSLKTLVDIYYNSIGRNASFLLNLPVDRRGLIHETDAEQLRKLNLVIQRDFEKNLIKGANTQASNVRKQSVRFNSKKVIDGDYNTYWTTDDFVTTGSLVIDFGKKTTFNRFLVQEYVPLGQRVERFSLEIYQDGKWQAIMGQTTIGYKRILRFDDVTASKVRFNVLQSKACPAISTIEIYRAPKLLEPPAILRDKYGTVTIEGFDTGLQIKYSDDGTEPTKVYDEPFEFSGKGHVKAVAIDTVSGESSEIAVRDFDIISLNWSVIGYKSDNSLKFIFDTFAQSVWRNTESLNTAQEVSIDLGSVQLLVGFTYLPPQVASLDGTIAEYSFAVSENGKDWTDISTGEFSNIKNNPVQQTVIFTKVPARYIRFASLREINDKPVMAIAEFGVLTY